MHSLFIFRDSHGRLPTARELLRCGFGVSRAALGPEGQPADPGPPRALALAAEAAEPYGALRPDEDA